MGTRTNFVDLLRRNKPTMNLKKIKVNSFYLDLKNTKRLCMFMR